MWSEIRAAYETAREHPATVGWLGLIAYVGAWDAFSNETLSEGVDRAITSHKLATFGAVAITGAHLLNLLPEQLDPIHHMASAIKYKHGEPQA